MDEKIISNEMDDLELWVGKPVFPGKKGKKGIALEFHWAVYHVTHWVLGKLHSLGEWAWDVSGRLHGV